MSPPRLIRRFEFFQRQEYFTIILAWIALRFDVYGTDQAAVLTSAQVGFRTHMGVVKAIPGRFWNKRNAAASVGRNEGSAFFCRSIHIRGNKLAVPMQLFRPVRLVMNVYDHLLALFEAEERPGKLAVVGGHRDDVIRGKLDGLNRDRKLVVWLGRRSERQALSDDPRRVGQRPQRKGTSNFLP